MAAVRLSLIVSSESIFMVSIRENTHKPSTRHAVTTVLVRAALPAAAIKLHIMIMVVDWRKEAAP